MEFVGSIKALLKEVLATDDPEKIRELAGQLSRRYPDANSGGLTVFALHPTRS